MRIAVESVAVAVKTAPGRTLAKPCPLGYSPSTGTRVSVLHNLRRQVLVAEPRFQSLLEV
ncbi:MAG: hypothetical protein F6K09_25240 [Merismopedia sp. SIO2A8]|nr:hypothetical protein [Merismopedia sp. SIO2A8]